MATGMATWQRQLSSVATADAYHTVPLDKMLGILARLKRRDICLLLERSIIVSHQESPYPKKSTEY